MYHLSPTIQMLHNSLPADDSEHGKRETTASEGLDELRI